MGGVGSNQCKKVKIFYLFLIALLPIDGSFDVVLWAQLIRWAAFSAERGLSKNKLELLRIV